jgi:hypothetical protein
MRKPKPTLLCYHCGEPANGGGDHVPPRSFFPPGKNPDLRVQLILKDPQIEIKDGQSYTSGEINVERIIFFMEAVARGVLHYDRHIRWDGEVKVLPHFLVDYRSPADLKKASKALLHSVIGGGVKGKNKLVFYYEIEDFSSTAGSPTFVVHMCFYGDTTVSVVFLDGVGVPQPQPY